MSLSFAASFGSVDSLKVRTRCGASRCASRMRCTERRLTPAAFASIRPVSGLHRRWRAERQIDHPLHDGGGKRLLAGLARLVAGEPVDTLGHECACHRQTTGFDLPERRMI